MTSSPNVAVATNRLPFLMVHAHVHNIDYPETFHLAPHNQELLRNFIAGSWPTHNDIKHHDLNVSSVGLDRSEMIQMHDFGDQQDGSCKEYSI